LENILYWPQSQPDVVLYQDGIILTSDNITWTNISFTYPVFPGETELDPETGSNVGYKVADDDQIRSFIDNDHGVSGVFYFPDKVSILTRLEASSPMNLTLAIPKGAVFTNFTSHNINYIYLITANVITTPGFNRTIAFGPNTHAPVFFHNVDFSNTTLTIDAGYLKTSGTNTFGNVTANLYSAGENGLALNTDSSINLIANNTLINVGLDAGNIELHNHFKINDFKINARNVDFTIAQDTNLLVGNLDVRARDTNIAGKIVIFSNGTLISDSINIDVLGSIHADFYFLFLSDSLKNHGYIAGKTYDFFSKDILNQGMIGVDTAYFFKAISFKNYGRIETKDHFCFKPDSDDVEFLNMENAIINSNGGATIKASILKNFAGTIELSNSSSVTIDVGTLSNIAKEKVSPINEPCSIAHKYECSQAYDKFEYSNPAIFIIKSEKINWSVKNLECHSSLFSTTGMINSTQDTKIDIRSNILIKEATYTSRGGTKKYCASDGPFGSCFNWDRECNDEQEKHIGRANADAKDFGIDSLEWHKNHESCFNTAHYKAEIEESISRVRFVDAGNAELGSLKIYSLLKVDASKEDDSHFLKQIGSNAVALRENFSAQIAAIDSMIALRDMFKLTFSVNMQRQGNTLSIEDLILQTVNAYIHRFTPLVENNAIATTGADGVQTLNYIFSNKFDFGIATDHKGTAYLLSELGFSTNEVLNIVGDPDFETELLKKAIFSESGKEYIIKSAKSHKEQVDELLNNAVDYGHDKDLALIPGEPLTKWQVAQLQEPILWPVKEHVFGSRSFVWSLKLFIDEGNCKACRSGSILEVENSNLHLHGTSVNLGFIESYGNNKITFDTLYQQNRIDSVGNLIFQTTQDLISFVMKTPDGYHQPTIEAIGTIELNARRDLIQYATLLQVDGDLVLKAGRDITQATIHDIIVLRNIATKKFRALEHTIEELYNIAHVTGNIKIEAGENYVGAGNIIISKNGKITIFGGHSAKMFAITAQAHNEQYQKNKRWYGSSSSAAQWSISKTAQPYLHSNNIMAITSYGECYFEGVQFNEKGEMQGEKTVEIKCAGGPHFVGHKVDNYYHFFSKSTGFSVKAPILDILQSNNPKQTLLDNIGITNALKQISNMQGPLDLAGLMKLVSEFGQIQGIMQKQNLDFNGALLQNILSDLASATLSFGTKKVTQHNTKTTIFESTINGNVIEIESGGEMLFEATKVYAKEILNIKAKGKVTVKSATEKEENAMQISDQSFDIGINLQGVKFGVSAMRHTNSYFATDEIGALLQAGKNVVISTEDDFSIKGGMVDGQKVIVNAKNIHIEDVLNTARSEGSTTSASAGVMVTWSGEILPYGSISASAQCKKLGKLYLANGITGESVVINGQSLTYNKQHLTPDVAELNVLEIIEQPRLGELYSDIAQGASGGITIDKAGKAVPNIGASVNNDGVVISGYWSENVFAGYNFMKDKVSELVYPAAKEAPINSALFASKEAQQNAQRRTREIVAEKAQTEQNTLADTATVKPANMGAGSEEAPASQPTKTGKAANDNKVSSDGNTYKAKVIVAPKVNVNGERINGIGHVIWVLSKHDTAGNIVGHETIIDQNPTGDNIPITGDSTVSSPEDVEQHYMAGKGKIDFISTEIRISKEAYKAGIMYGKTSLNKEAYVAGFNDCVNRGDNVYKILGLEGDIGDLFTMQDLKNSKTLAMSEVARRFGLQEQTVYVTRHFSTLEQVARDFNVPVKRVERIEITSDSDVLHAPNYKILPPKRD